MAAPTVASTTTKVEATDVTSGSITAPATVDAGDLLIIWWAHDALAGTVTPPSGWTELVPDAADSASQVGGAIWVKDAAGDEGGASITWSWTTAQTYTAICARVTGWGNATLADVEVSTKAEGASTAPDASALTPALGSADYLWLTSEFNDSSRYASVFPYASNNVSANTAPTVGNGLSICTTTSVPGTTLDAGAWTLTASEQWLAYTVSVPYVAPPAGTQVADGASLTAILNEVAGTTGLEADGAINAFMGTSGVPLVKALNDLAGTSGVELQGVLNVLAGTSGVGVDEAARLITWVAP